MKTIFAIDNGSDPRVRARFERYLDEKAALGLLVGGRVRLAVGYWEGELESSYVLDAEDFDAFVRGEHWVTNQSAILHFSADGSWMEDLATGDVETLPVMRCVSKEAALAAPGWTYMLDNNTFWTTF